MEALFSVHQDLLTNEMDDPGFYVYIQPDIEEREGL
jgi:hypothetical protein